MYENQKMRQIIFMFYFILFASVLQMFQKWYDNIFKNVPPEVPTTLSLTI